MSWISVITDYKHVPEAQTQNSHGYDSQGLHELIKRTYILNSVSLMKRLPNANDATRAELVSNAEHFLHLRNNNLWNYSMSHRHKLTSEWKSNRRRDLFLLFRITGKHWSVGLLGGSRSHRPLDMTELQYSYIIQRNCSPAVSTESVEKCRKMRVKQLVRSCLMNGRVTMFFFSGSAGPLQKLKLFKLFCRMPSVCVSVFHLWRVSISYFHEACLSSEYCCPLTDSRWVFVCVCYLEPQGD